MRVDYIPRDLGQQTQTLLRMTMESALTAKVSALGIARGSLLTAAGATRLSVRVRAAVAQHGTDIVLQGRQDGQCAPAHRAVEQP
jgi:hypothetical protein